MKLSIASLVRDAGTQPRAALDEPTVTRYAEEAGPFPAVVVFHDGARHILADGFHRTAAAERRGETEIEADVRQGDVRAAILYSVGANHDHGLPRSNEDKRRAVLRLLDDAEWREWSNVAIAKACRVSEFLVRSLRPAPTSIESKSPERRGLDGRTINTGRIGERPADTAAASPPVLCAPPRLVEGPPPPFVQRFEEITNAAAEYDRSVNQMLDGLIGECPHERRSHLAQLLRAAAERAER